MAASRTLKRLGWAAAVLLLLHFAIESTGHHYLYKTLAFTVFKGRLGPHIQEFQNLPGRTIHNDQTQPWADSKAYGSHSLSADDEAYHDAFGSVAFVVVHKDSLLHEQYWDQFSETSMSNSFSMAKSMVGALVGIAIKRGEIESVDDPVYRYLPQYKGGLGDKLTIRHLLTMSAGIDFNENYINPFAFPARANYGDNLEQLLRNYHITEEPGVYFDYQSGSTQILAFALMSATRSSLSDYMSSHLWKAVGAEHHAIWSLDREHGDEKAFCCVNAAATDFARIGSLYLHQGNWRGTQLIDSAFVATSTSPPGTINRDGTPCDTYGYSWWLGAQDGLPFYMMRGIKGQYVIVVPDKELIIVRLGHERDGKKERQHPEDVYHYLDMGLRMIAQ